MMKLRIATGVGLLLFLASMIGGPVGMSQAQDHKNVTLADLAGKFATRGSGFSTSCFTPGLGAQDCATATNAQPINLTLIGHVTRDAAGNSCGSNTSANAPVFGTRFPAFVPTNITVGTTKSFDPTTGSGTANVSRYVGGSCNGAAFDGGGTLIGTGTTTFVVSDSGNRIEAIVTSFVAVTAPPFSVAGSIQGFVLSQTNIRE